ncbi:MAG: hypothetical protein QG639_347 [Patescibacteria group bacterium]|nr:hypothetical protein [Patescibacteria group bacterium]
MSNNDFLEQIRGVNENYNGKMKSITFVVQRDNKEKKIFKWLFSPNSIDFYISFPYYTCSEYHCGVVEIPQSPKKDNIFNAVENGVASKVPVKFSFHKDGNIHFKPTSYQVDDTNKGYKLAALKVKPIDQLNGSHIFTIRFEGLDKFADLKKHKNRNGNQEVLLPVPDDIINFEIQAFAGPNKKSIDGHIKKGSIPWFQISGQNHLGEPVFIGIYAILSRKSHILDENKNGLTVFVGFDDSELKKTDSLKSLYLFAR